MKDLVSVFVIIACAGCTTLNIPATNFMTSEAVGKGKASLVFTVQTADETWTNRYSRINDENGIFQSMAFSMNGRYGLQHKIDGYANLSFDWGPHSTNSAGVKIQLLGRPRNLSKKGNFSASILGGILYNESRYESSSSDFDTYGNESGIRLGYRVDNDLLVYIGSDLSTIRARFRGNVVIPENRQTGDKLGFTLGFQKSYKKGGVIQYEFGYSQLEWMESSSKYYHFGIALGG